MCNQWMYDIIQVRLKLRMKRKEFQDGMVAITAPWPVDDNVWRLHDSLTAVGMEEGGEDEEKADVIINIKELDDVLMKDVGNHIASSGK